MALPEDPTSPSFFLCSVAEIQVTNSPTCLGLHPGVPIWSGQLRQVLKAQVPRGVSSQGCSCPAALPRENLCELPVPPLPFQIPSRQMGALVLWLCSGHGQHLPAPARQGEIPTPEWPLAHGIETELSAASVPCATSEPMQNTTPAGRTTGKCAASIGKTLPVLH